MKGVRVRLERLLCSCGKYCSFKLCRVKFVSREVVTGNVILVTKKKITAWKDYIQTFYKFSNNEYRPMGIHTGYDFCAAQEGLLNSVLNRVIMNILSNNTNWNQKCPFQPGEYYVKNLNFHAKHLPSLVPAGRYLANITSHIQGYEWLYNMSVYFSVSNYGIQDMNVG